MRLDNTYVAHRCIEIKKSVSEKESTIISNAMNIASRGKSYAKKNGQQSLLKKWDDKKALTKTTGQCIERYYCCAFKDCTVQYKVQRLQGEIGVYHQHEVPKWGGLGITEAGKSFVRENMHAPRSINHVTGKIMDLAPA